MPLSTDVHGLPRTRAAVLVATMSLAIPVFVAAPVAHAAGVIEVTTTNQEINADAECSLQEAISSANRDENTAVDPTDPATILTTGCAAGDGDDTIFLPAGAVFTVADPITDYANYTGPTATPIVTSTIDIEGQGARLQRVALGRQTRAFAVGATGDLTLHELHLVGFAVHGGNGADGGGGGMGAGGAVYVQGGRLGIGWSTFEGNSAVGGNGSYQDTFAGGGGGGLSGNGGPSAGYGGGGGGGARGDGGVGQSDLGGGGGGTVTSGQTPQPGEACGGAGGVYDEITGGADDGDDAEYPPFFCAGGGGGGGTERIPFFDPFAGGSGGDGSYGGGGGGAGEDADGGHGGFGGGGGGAFDGNNGGDGGFGGGGGSGSAIDIGVEVGSRGQGGTFAGDGAVNGGGGGAALGGAIFGYGATIEIQNSTFTANSVRRGLSGKAGGEDPASDGRGAGGAIFAVAGSLHIDGSTIAGNTANEVNTDPGTGAVSGLGGGGIVVYKPTTGESASLRLRNSIVSGNGAFECYTRNGVSVTGTSHNIITSEDPNSAGDARCVGVASSVDPQLGALQLNAPGRTPTMAIPADSSARDAADPATAPVDDQRGVFRDPAPDIGAYEFTGQAPVTTIGLDPASPDGANGWYVSPVTVTVGATDADSAVSETRCVLDPASVPATFAELPAGGCAVTTVDADGAHSIYAASADALGNVELSVVSDAFEIDRTPPVLAPALSATTVALGQTGVTATPNASDATSGLGSASCDPADTSTPGPHAVQCTATDVAGNSATASVDYLVGYRILGFFSPVPGSKWRAGQTVPIKVALGDVNGQRITDAVGAQLAASCAVAFSVAGAQSKSSQCLKYDANQDQFVYDWKVAKRPLGAATITVTVSYAGTTATTSLSEPITIVKS